MTNIPTFTLADLEQVAARIEATPDNPLRFHSGCGPNAGLVGVFQPGARTIELRCMDCDGIAARIAIAGTEAPPTSAGLVSLGGWTYGDIPPDESAMTQHAVKTHLAALNTLPQQVRNNVVVSVLMSFLIGFTDPAREFATMAEQFNTRLPELLARRDLLTSEPEGNA